MIPHSTIAMSAVSLLGTIGMTERSRVVDVITAHFALHRVTRQEIESAVDEAIARDLIVVSGVLLRTALPAGCVIQSRERNGDGWGNWIARSPSGETAPVEQLLLQGGA